MYGMYIKVLMYSLKLCEC